MDRGFVRRQTLEVYQLAIIDVACITTVDDTTFDVSIDQSLKVFAGLTLNRAKDSLKALLQTLCVKGSAPVSYTHLTLPTTCCV